MSVRGQREVDLFAAAMLTELERNQHKGEWAEMTAEAMVIDLSYHVAKLGFALAAGHKEGIREYAADVGNQAMMVADIAGVLELAAAEAPTLISDVAPDQPYEEIREDLLERARLFIEGLKAKPQTAEATS